MKKKLILASSSPRRREILEKTGLEFEIIPSDYEEVFDDFNFTYEKIEQLAYNKAKFVADASFSRFTHASLILGADTVVVLDGQILCKPQNDQDAVNMLKKLSGKRHSVVTSICVIDSKTFQYKTLSKTSFVEFNDLSDDLIIKYVEQFEPLDKAGSYGIQELPEGFIRKIEGSFENIIGLCPLTVEKILGEFR